MNQQLLGKEEWFKKKLRNDFLIFDKGEFPAFTNTGYDSVLFGIINSAYIKKNNLDSFFKALEPFINFDDGKNKFVIDSKRTEEIKESLSDDRILSGLTVFELNPKETSHLEFLEGMGAVIPQEVMNNSIPILGEKAIKLNNWNEYIKGKYDITISNGLMDENSGIRYNNHSAVFSAFELYTIFANITKKNGFSFHSNGSQISSLYETYFQFIGFKVIEYFRNSDGQFNFTMIMKKINEQVSDYNRFFYTYTELKRRWPTRYGN